MTAIADFPLAHGRVVIRDRLGMMVRHGKDLGVVTRFAALHPVDVVELRRLPDGYGVAFHYLDGQERYHALTYWADWRVAMIFLQGRRSWGINRISVDKGLYDDVAEHWTTKRLRAHGTGVHERKDAR